MKRQRERKKGEEEGKGGRETYRMSLETVPIPYRLANSSSNFVEFSDKRSFSPTNK